MLNGDIGFEYCDTNSQLADLFTKPLDEQKFNHFANQIFYDSGADPSHSMVCLFNEGIMCWGDSHVHITNPGEIMTRHFGDV